MQDPIQAIQPSHLQEQLQLSFLYLYLEAQVFVVAQVVQAVPELQELVRLEPLELVERLVLVGCMELVELEELVLVGLEYLFPLPLCSYAISLQLIEVPQFSELFCILVAQGLLVQLEKLEKPVLLVLVESVL